MKLQILIPQYKETDAIIAPLLKSIAIQQGVDVANDVGVIICNDGSDVKLSPDFLNGFPFNVEYIQQEHKGVSAARNACLDRATADYVMFADCDDMFLNVCGLYIVFREMEGNGFNAFTSVFIEETRDPKTHNTVYINRQNDSTFVHGKVYRRKYLVKNNIRFNDDLTVHEDSYFNCLAQRLAGEVKYCQTPFYLWKWRDESVCRHDPKYILKTYNNMLDSNTALVQEFLDRGRIQDAQYYVTAMIYDAYYTMNKDEWLNQENQEYRNRTELRFKEYYQTFQKQFNDIPKELKQQIIVGMRNRFFGEGMFLESVTFGDWIKHIMDLGE